MSGIEIVGLVLGALPLLMKSIEAYSETLSAAQRILSPRRELRRIRSRVNIALQVFRNTAKLLLLRVVEAQEVSRLLKEPGSRSWQDVDFDRKLKKLLGDSYSAWRVVMEDINSAVEDIKLCLKISLEETADRINTTQRLKLGFSKGKIEEAMKRIDAGNRHFQRLTDQAVSLAAVLADHCSDLPDFRQMRAAASQSFAIMDSGLQCQCKSRHVLCLGLGRTELSHKTSFRTHGDEKHRIVLASQSRPGQPAKLEYVADVEISVTLGQSSGQTKLGVQHWTGDCSCLAFLANSGIVTDSASILPVSSLPLTLRHTLVSVQTLLPSTARQKGKLRARGRRYTALMASWSLLRLYSTPWLQKDAFQSVISFIRGEDGSLVDLPFISKQLEPAVNLAVKSRYADPTSLICIRNAWVYALGIFLIELCLGQTIAELREPQDEIAGGQLPFLTEYQTAVRLIDEVEDQAGLRYSTAVRRCVRCDFDERVYDLDNARFCKAIYKGVIALLEEDIRQLDGIENDQQHGQYVCFS